MRKEKMMTRTQCTYTVTAKVYDTASSSVKEVVSSLNSSDERRVEETLKLDGLKLLEIIDITVVWIKYTVPVSAFMKLAKEVGTIEVCEAPPVGRGHKAEKEGA